jgi:molybdate transport system ATP-binding protein
VNLDAHVALHLGSLDLEVRLSVEAGEVVALVGPNGAGKTTLLRALAGLQTIDRGCIELAGHVLEDPSRGVRRGPTERAVGMVFQDHLLFPHLTALENVAFGPRAQGIPARDARKEAADWLGRIGIEELMDARPLELSGGQRQRVALARALASRPALLLLDEPLAALDAETRQQVRRELRRHLGAFAGSTLLVTHDPLEALTLADRLVVLEGGRIVQDAVPAEVTSRPRSAWIATLVGLNLLRGIARGTEVELDGGATLELADPALGEVHLVIHPRAVALHRDPPRGSPRNVIALEVDSLDVLGNHVRVTLEGALDLVAEVTPGGAAQLDLAAGGTVYAAVKAVEIDAYPA